MDSETKLCVFFDGSRGCTILKRRCIGTSNSCAFQKTYEQFIADRDKSILMNRRKGKCTNCEYVNVPCQLSTEHVSVND